jgi:hypothetical protein
MNTPFKGQIDWLPDFIGEELMNQQELVGNKRDISVFEKNIKAEINEGGFGWYKSERPGSFWFRILIEQDINLFLAWFKPELEVFDDEGETFVKEVIAYIKNVKHPFFLKKEDNFDFAFKHARLPKKENAEKLELLKKADELLTKAAELKAAAEKL